MEIHFQLEKDRLINSTKTAIACLIGYAITYFFQMPMGAWILITIIVVMSNQINVGGVVMKSSMQLLGTMTGTLVSILILFLFGDHTLPITITLFFSIFIFSYLASSQKEMGIAGLLGATTVIITLLSPNPTYETALLRFLEISIGILLAFVISKFFFPIHAYQKIYDSIAKTMACYSQLYEALWEKNHIEATENNVDHDSFSDIETQIISVFATQRKLIREAASELTFKAVNQATYSKILTSQRETFRYICLMHQAVLKIQFTPEQMQQLTAFNQHVYFWLDQLVKGLKGERFKLESNNVTKVELIPLIQGLKQLPLSSSQQLAIDAFFFCALNLVRELRRLSRLISLLIAKRGKTRRTKND